MARFADFVKGTRARKAIQLPLPGAQFDLTTAAWVGPTAPLHLRVLKMDEYTDIVLKEAKAFARARGEPEPEEGQPLYEQGKMLHTLAVACIDADSPEDKPEPFFRDWMEIHGSEILTPEVIGYLYLQQRLWQDEVSPLAKSLDPAEFFTAAVRTAGGDLSFFVGMRPGVLWNFTRTLAALHVNSTTRTSPGSSPSSAPTATTS